jgi:response regulator RpfG family c-di-GMP phosphodiesterase
MLLIAVICDTRSHLASLRNALNEIGVRYKLEALDTDLSALCHLSRAAEYPDLVLVNGTLTVYEAPQFLVDLKKALTLSQSCIAVMDPLEEDLQGLEQLGVSLFLRKPVSPAALKEILRHAGELRSFNTP